MLNVILGHKDIQIRRMEVQKVEKSPSADGRSVIQYIFAVDSSGKHYDVEVQRADYGADKKRARFLSGVLDSRMLKTSEDFVNLNKSFAAGFRRARTSPKSRRKRLPKRRTGSTAIPE